MFTIGSASDRIQIPAGSVLRFPCTWQEYDNLEQNRGGISIPRMKYRHGELVLMVPLPEHGKDAHVLSRIVEVLLEQQGLDHDAFTPVTMKLPERGGIEPDYCFYIDNWQAVRGMRRIDWERQPPPDLVIEVDVTNYSEANDYLVFEVPEVWLLKGSRLQINKLVQSSSVAEPEYIEVAESRYFPGRDLQAIVADCLRIAYDQNTSAAIRHLKADLD